MLVLLTPPAIGTAVTSGAFATKDLETPKRTGFNWAKKGVRPVAVGPCDSSQLMGDFFLGTFNTGIYFWRRLEVLWYLAARRSFSSGASFLSRQAALTGSAVNGKIKIASKI